VTGEKVTRGQSDRGQSDQEANILDAKKLVWSQVNLKLRCMELFMLESQTSRGEERNFGLLGFEFKIDLKKNKKN
jgi:hypothetical protein